MQGTTVWLGAEFFLVLESSEAPSVHHDEGQHGSETAVLH